MTLLFPVLLTFTVFVASLGLTGWFRRHALAHLLLDVPNYRSSHAIATPRGGGVAIVLSTLAALLALGWTHRLDRPSVGSLCVGGALVALIGFVDDREHVAPRWRLVGHFAAASWALVMLGGAPPLAAMGLVLVSGWLGFVIAALYLVWMLNLTNFMDGIDGIAGVEAITVCLSAVLLSGVAAPGEHLWIAPLVLASATLGFLVWNWPPAKIFMGDAGSGFLGLTLAVCSLRAGWVVNRLFWSWAILLGVFVVDATVTLIRRMARGERFYEAHRSHAYQHAAVQRGAHMPVTVAVGIINICWLLPVALVVGLGWLDGLTGVLISYAPLVVAAVRLNAGRPSSA
ncbi:MAG: glycosyltransferase family 4 protein [Gemmatimonadota bacterium]|nr:glycosyltransferase family 4 protein [Gemmatimonadota bacterium]